MQSRIWIRLRYWGALVVQDPPPVHRLAQEGTAARSSSFDLRDVGQEYEARADRPTVHVAEVDGVLFRVGVSDQRGNYLSARPQTSQLADLCEVRVQQFLAGLRSLTPLV